MSRLVRRSRRDPAIRYTALGLVNDLPPKDRWREIRRCFDFVREEMRYVRDIAGTDTLHFAEQLLWQACGDCDDKSVLLCALLESIGLKTALKAVGFEPGQLTHVYPLVHFGRRGRETWIAMDATVNYPMGWQPKGIVCQLTIKN